MKKILIVLLITVMALTACQQAPKPVVVDVEAEKAVLDSIFDVFTKAFSASDVATLSSYLNEDALCLGSDPSEFFTKQQMTDMWTQMLSAGAIELNYVSERIIVIAADGHSATVIDQYVMPGYSKIPMRNAYHLIKTDAGWKIFVLNCAFIPKNEDVPKLNGALE